MTGWLEPYRPTTRGGCGFSNRCSRVGRKKKERTNERTGVNPDDGGGARGNQEADRSTDAMRTAKAVRFVHIEKSSIHQSSVSLFQPVVRFSIPFRRSVGFRVPFVPSVSAFHDHRSIPPCVVHPRRRRRASSSSSSSLILVVRRRIART